jgi:hypothetical protein
MTLRLIAALVLGCSLPVLASGCAASTNSSSTLPSLESPTSAGASSAAKKQKVRFVIRIAKKTHRGRAPKYLSPSTQSILIHVALGSATKLNKAISLTLGSRGCISTAANAQCELDISLKPANGYIASFTTYDGPNGTGNVLSVAANAVFNVLTGQKTIVGLTLNGVPASLEVFSAGANAFYAVTLDPDGNIIVGPGAPTIAANASGAVIATVNQPTALAPNTVAISQIPGASGTETLGITAGYPLGATNSCAAPGAVCSFPNVATLHNGQEIFLANYYSTVEPVFAYTAPFTSNTQSPDATINSIAVGSVATDASGNLFIGQYSASGSLFEYAPPYTGAAIATSSGIDKAQGLAIGADGTAFVAGSAISVSAAPYTSAATTFAGSSTSIAVDASGNAYAGEGSVIAMFTPPYTSGSTAKYTVNLASTAEYGILVSGNKLYVGEQGDVQIFSLPITMNNPAALATISSGISYAFGLALDPAGNLYVASYYGSASAEGGVTIYNAPQTSGELPAATIAVNYYPSSLLFDAAGNFYVSTYEGGSTDEGTLQEFKPPFTSSSVPAFTLNQGIYYPYGNTLAITPTPKFSMTLNQ